MYTDSGLEDSPAKASTGGTSTAGETSVTTTPASLDERKLEHEIASRQRELDLTQREIEAKEREVAAKEREVATKESELERSRWMNPTVIGILVAGIGLVSSVWVAHLNNITTQTQERIKAQSSIILEAIKTGTGNTDAACKNLVFLSNLQLIDDTNHTIPKQCASVPPGIPSLPSAGEVAHFTRSEHLTPEVQRTLNDTLLKFREYLAQFGIQPPIIPEIEVNDAKIDQNGCFHACEVAGTIYLRSSYATPALVVHEFAHTVLFGIHPGADGTDQQWMYSAIEAGIANYLTADFLNSPIIDNYSLTVGTPLAEARHTWTGGQNEGGLAWGAFLWNLRTEAAGEESRKLVTRAVVRSWMGMNPGSSARNCQEKFLQGLRSNGLESSLVNAKL